MSLRDERPTRADVVGAAWFLVVFVVGLCLIYMAMNCPSVTVIGC